jgi:hypothetical protein
MEPFTSTGTSTITAAGLWVHPLSGGGTSIGTTYPSSVTVPSTPNNTVSFTHPINFSSNSTSKQIMQNKVAVFKVTRDEDDKITKTEFIKELWVETKNGQSVDFQVARDKDLAEYEMSELSIRTVFSLSF